MSWVHSTETGSWHRVADPATLECACGRRVADLAVSAHKYARPKPPEVLCEPCAEFRTAGDDQGEADEEFVVKRREAGWRRG